MRRPGEWAASTGSDHVADHEHLGDSNADFWEGSKPAWTSVIPTSAPSAVAAVVTLNLLLYLTACSFG